MKLFLTLLLISSSVLAEEYHENPYTMFSTDKNFTTRTNINWIVVDNIQETCDKLKIKHTGKPFPYKVLACSQWKNNLIFKSECNIYTAKNVNTLTLGHEVRHCFQGDFH